MQPSKRKAAEDSSAQSAPSAASSSSGSAGGAEAGEVSESSSRRAISRYEDLGTAKFLFEDVTAAEQLRHERTLGGTGTHGNGVGQFAQPYQITMDGDDNAIVVDSSNHRLQVISRDGDVVCTAGGFGEEDGKFKLLCGVAMNKQSGRVYAADCYDHRIQEFALEKEPVYRLQFVRAIGSFGSKSGELKNPISVAVSERSGRIYVVEVQCSNKRVHVLTEAGEYVQTIGEDTLQNPECVAVDENEQVYVADYQLHRVFVFDDEGRLVSEIGGDGQLRHPRAVCIDHHRGHIVVGDENGIHILNKQDFGLVCRLQDKAFTTSGVAVDSQGRILASNFRGHTIERWS